MLQGIARHYDEIADFSSTRYIYIVVGFLFPSAYNLGLELFRCERNKHYSADWVKEQKLECT
jgi:hypothetical protein